MSDNVYDLTTGQPLETHSQEQAQRKRDDALRQRFEDAPDIAARLRGTHRVEPEDREVFAANLALMCQEAAKEDSTSLRRIFEAAFGENFEAKYKKRKRFVCATDEDPPDEFTAHGSDFVNLAEATAIIAHAGKPKATLDEAARRAILQLIAGSSHDDRRPLEARKADEAKAALGEAFEQIVHNAKSLVDLNAMRAVFEDDAVSAIIDGDGNVERLVVCETYVDERGPERDEGESDESYELRCGEHERSRMLPAQRALSDAAHSQHDDDELSETLSAVRHMGLLGPNDRPVLYLPGSLDDPDVPAFSANLAASPFAPRVVVGAIYSPTDVAGAVLIEIDETEIERAVAKDALAYERAITRSKLAESAPEFDRAKAFRERLSSAALKVLAERVGYSDARTSDWCQSLDDLELKIEADARDTSEVLWTDGPEISVVARRQIELKLMRDSTTRWWRVCLGLSQGLPLCDFGGSGREGVYGATDGDGCFVPSVFLGLSTVLWQSDEFAHCLLHKVSDNRFLVYLVEDAEFPKQRIFGIGMGWLSIPSELALDALLTPIEGGQYGEHEIDAPFHRHWNKPAPAKWNTLAGMILRNLAYAPDEERLDLLLLQDAKKKADMTRHFAEERRKEFETAIQRLKE